MDAAPHDPPQIIRAAAIMGSAFKKLEEGMPKDQVISLLGKPDGFRHDGNVETLTYANRMMSGSTNASPNGASHSDLRK